MAFPRAKANHYDYGIHMPSAVKQPGGGRAGRVADDLLQFVDLTATILDFAGVEHPGGASALAGRSIRGSLESEQDGLVDVSRTRAFSGPERHSSSCWNNLTHPQRSMRALQYLYIRTFRPQRWPAGAPQKYVQNSSTLEAMHLAYHDIDRSPSLATLIKGREEKGIAQYFEWAVGKRPAEELFDLGRDPGCLDNLAEKPEFADVLERLRRELEAYLVETEDPRVTDGGQIWGDYIRSSRVRKFPRPPTAGPDY